jgi:hypothetical protein
LLATRSTFFGFDYVLLCFQAHGSSEKLRFRISFNGEIKEISEHKFAQSAGMGAFVVCDGFSVAKVLLYQHSLWIVSPSSCVEQWPTGTLLRYAPPPEPEEMHLLSDVSRRYPFSDDDANDPDLLRTHGSIQRRMEITGGNLRLLFGDLSLAELEAFFMRAANGMNFVDAPTDYFLPTDAGDQDPYHLAFTCFPKEPFDAPLELGFVSDFVMDLVVARYEGLQSIEFENALCRTRNIIHLCLGFS